MTNEILTQSRLKELLHYDPDTGVFTWVNPSKFNGYLIGSKAGYLHGGYIKVRCNGAQYLLHRLAWLYVYGCFPSVIDHINGDKKDNRIKNLRDAGYTLNNRNKKKNKNNTSGITGVVWCKSDKKWHARILIMGKQMHLGSFDCKYRAASVRHLAQEIDGGYTSRHGI